MPSPDGAEIKGRQGSIRLAQEIPDPLGFTDVGHLEVRQPLLGNSQFLHLPLC
jgi:hypothetical protein